MWFKFGLKAQKLLAQGIALGIKAVSKAPCKGKSFMYCLDFLSFCPYRATDCVQKRPRALPWAKSFCPFRACCVIPTVQVESLLAHKLNTKYFILIWKQ